MTLKNLFFPEKINNYYLFDKKVVAVHVTPGTIHATILKAQGRSFTLLASISEHIGEEKGNYHEKITLVLEKLLKKIEPYDKLVVTLPNSHTFFKELRLPFVSKEKISLVLHYEIEAYLPFPLNDADFDCLMLTTYPEKNASDIIVVATQKKYLKEYLIPFTKLDATPSVVTVDILAVYQLYTKIKNLYPMEEAGALVVFDSTAIHIAYLSKGNLKTVRSLHDDAHNPDTTWQSLIFTLQSFSQEYGTMQRVLFIGTQQEKVQKTHTALGIPCDLFALEKCFTALSLTPPSVASDSIDLVSLAAAYSSFLDEDFNLATQEASEHQTVLFKKQVIITGILTGILLVALSAHTFLQIHKLSTAVESVKMSTVKELRKNFPTIKSNNLVEALKVAKNTVSKEEEIWFSFSNQTRRSFLKYLYVLSTKIERDTIGLNLKKLVINKDSIILEGSVRSFDAVNQLEQELKDTNLFKNIPDFQRTEFAQTLTLSTQGDTQ